LLGEKQRFCTYGADFNSAHSWAQFKFLSCPLRAATMTSTAQKELARLTKYRFNIIWRTA
jgi:hypothetical protein